MKRGRLSDLDVDRIINAVPPVQSISDEAAAFEILRQLKKSRASITSDLPPEPPPSSTAAINKTFLVHMIRDVESHNRREEVADCWRQHDQIKKAQAARVLSTANSDDINSERDKWARLKLQKLESSHRLNDGSVGNTADANIASSRPVTTDGTEELKSREMVKKKKNKVKNSRVKNDKKKKEKKRKHKESSKRY